MSTDLSGTVAKKILLSGVRSMPLVIFSLSELGFIHFDNDSFTILASALVTS